MSKTYVIDIDGTICDWQAGRDYTLASPFPERIRQINNLYVKGNTINQSVFLSAVYFLGDALFQINN